MGCASNKKGFAMTTLISRDYSITSNGGDESTVEGSASQKNGTVQGSRVLCSGVEKRTSIPYSQGQ
jgi:hypothetical protein